MEKIINIKKDAMDFIKNNVEAEKCLGIRVDVLQGGCHGMTYSVDYISEINESDVVIVDEGITVCVASRAAIFLYGMTMDYVKTSMGGNLVFENPNAKSSCGCGKSFCADAPENPPCGSSGKCCP